MPAKNKYGRKGVPVSWDAIKSLWCSGGKTAKEIAAIFGIVQNTIETRAKREGWHAIRERVLAEKKLQQLRGGPSGVVNPFASIVHPPIGQSETFEQAPTKPEPVIISRRSDFDKTAKDHAPDDVIVERALAIVDSTKFRERVIAANDKALTVLEKTPPTNVGEVDRFAEALTKVERIGARTYGYDRETERPVINIGVLTSGAEYES
jgi:hypothetical protein